MNTIRKLPMSLNDCIDRARHHQSPLLWNMLHHQVKRLYTYLHILHDTLPEDVEVYLYDLYQECIRERQRTANERAIRIADRAICKMRQAL